MKRTSIPLFSILSLAILLMLACEGNISIGNSKKNSTSIFSQPWGELEFDHVKGYYFADYQSRKTGKYIWSDEPIITENNELNPTVWDKEGVLLSRDEVALMLDFPADSAFNAEKMKIKMNTRGYYLNYQNRHHHYGIVFWDSLGNPKAWAEMGFGTSTSRQSKELTVTTPNLYAAALIFKRKGIPPTFTYPDMYEYGKQFAKEHPDSDIIVPQVDKKPQFRSKKHKDFVAYLNAQYGEEKFQRKKNKDSLVISFMVGTLGRVDPITVDRPDEIKNHSWKENLGYSPATLRGGPIRYPVREVVYLK